MNIIKDYSVTTSYGFYKCVDCLSRFYGNGVALHNEDCPTKDEGYKSGDEGRFQVNQQEVERLKTLSSLRKQ